MSVRNEVLREFNSEIAHTGEILLNHRSRKIGREELIEICAMYHQKRKPVIRHQLANYFGIVIYGSARILPGDREWCFAEELGYQLVKNIDADIITGGGPGAMAAAPLGGLRARKEAEAQGILKRSKNHGVRIYLASREEANPYSEIDNIHKEFPTRLQHFSDITHCAYFMPGGHGTDLELVIYLQEKQVGHLDEQYLGIAHPFWLKIMQAKHESMFYDRVANNETPYIDGKDLKLVQYSDNTEVIVKQFKAQHDKWQQGIHKFVKFGSQPRRSSAFLTEGIALQ